MEIIELDDSEKRKVAIDAERIKWDSSIIKCGCFYFTDSANSKQTMIFDKDFQLKNDDLINVLFIPKKSYDEFIKTVYLILESKAQKDRK